MNIEKLSIQQSMKNYKLIESKFKRIQVESISYVNDYAGSKLYILIGESNLILYVGETETSLYKRIKGNGSGSHSRKPWFKDVRIVSFIELPNNKFIRRKWENEVIITLNPMHNSK